MKNRLKWLAMGSLILVLMACMVKKPQANFQHNQNQRHDESSQANQKGDSTMSVIRPTLDIDSLRKKVLQYVPTKIGFDKTRFSPEQNTAIRHLVEASKIMDQLFWMQSSEHGMKIRSMVEQDSSLQPELLTYLKINYGAYDRLDEMRPFLEVIGRPELVAAKRATYYPVTMTKEEFVKHLEANPQDAKEFVSNFTVIRKKEGMLQAIPYSDFYREQLTQANRLLNLAAEKVSNQSLQKYLRSRASAFFSNDYFQSDVDWMDVDSDLEVTIGPYEVYEDSLFNYKAAFESFITVRDLEESRKLEKIAETLVDMEKNLPIPDEHKNFDRGLSSPLIIADLIYSAGDTRAGVQTMAFNLPNDERVREKKGSKKVMLKNISKAKFNSILSPIAERLLVQEQMANVSFDAYFNHTLMHEVSHGLGPGFIQKDGKRQTVNVFLKELYSTIEEAKADILGMYNTLYLIDRGILPANLRSQTLVTYLAGIFRSVRFGVMSAHGKANMLSFNYLLDRGAYCFDEQKKRYFVDFQKAPDAIRSLAKDLLMLEATGDYARAKEMLHSLGEPRAQMKSALDSLTDIPVDIFPVFEIE